MIAPPSRLRPNTMTHEASPNDPVLPRGLHVSITQASEETGKTRETIAKKLAGADVTPSGTVRQLAVYRLRDVIRVLYLTNEDGSSNPDKLDPHSRHSHYKAEREKLSLQAEAGEYIEVERYRDEIARVAKLFAQTLDSIPDLLERDCAATPAMVERTQQELDKLRASLAEGLAEPRIKEAPDVDLRRSESDDGGGDGHPAPAEAHAPERSSDGIFSM